MNDDPRREELAARLTAVRERVARAEVAAGREPGSARLMVVTKYFPAADLARLVNLGATEFGENREPEAGRKVAAVRAGESGVPLDPGAEFSPEVEFSPEIEFSPEVEFSMDMIGSVQRKKAKTIARWARRVQSVDSPELIDALAVGAAAALAAGERDAPLGILLQLSLDGDPARGGVVEAELAALAEQVNAHTEALTLDGLMVIPPVAGDPAAHFATAAQVAASFRREYPDAVELSAGMSGDLESAIESGSTCVRVGTAIMGARPLVSP